ncbi:MAG: ribonucleotide-diphosphate reductase subunit beta, partial [Fusobacteriaceae bacterium]
MASPWSPHEVQMGSDLTDWKEVSEKERIAITKILRGFTLAEEGVSCYWGSNIASFFKAPEIVNMA